ncbi:MAG: LysR substrate-binding domain-containing protein, partial [Pygmaiobacter sp.]
NVVPDSELFDHRKVCSDHIMIAAPYNEKMKKRFPNQCSDPEHPIVVDLSTLEDETLIVLRPWQNMRIAAEAVCRHFSFAPRHVVESSSLASALSLVGSNRGITFVCQSSVSCIRPETPIIYFSVGKMENFTAILAVYRKDAANTLIKEFCACAERSLEPLTENESMDPMEQ